MCRVGIPGQEYLPVRTTAILRFFFSLAVLFTSTQVFSKPSTPAESSFTFEQNLGQWPESVQYVSRLAQLRIVFYTQHVTFINTTNNTTILTLELVSSSGNTRISADTPLKRYSNYYSGQSVYHPQHFARLRYRNVYPNIDLVFYEKQGSLEYDFIVNPGAQLSNIALRFNSKTPVEQAGSELFIKFDNDYLRQHAPYAYQIIGNETREIQIQPSFVDTILRFASNDYDKKHPLIIDPVIEYQTRYLRGNLSDTASAIKVDADRNIYIAGSSYSDSFEEVTSNTPPGADSRNIFIAKYLPDTAVPQFITFISGSKEDIARGLAIDTKGNTILASETNSPDLPIIDSTSTYKGSWDAYISRLDSQGRILQGFYVGGIKQDFAHAIASGPEDEIIIAGETGSADFPTTTTGFITDCELAANCNASNAYITMFNTKGSMTYSSLFGGTGRDAVHAIALDSNGIFHLGGETESSDLPLRFPTQPKHGGKIDGFIALIDPREKGASSLTYASYLGGLLLDSVTSIAVDSANHTLIAGITNSPDFPTTENAFARECGSGPKTCNVEFGDNDIFVSSIDHSAHSQFSYSSYLGGDGDESVAGIAVDSDDHIIVAGNTYASDFPVTDNARNRKCISIPSCQNKADIILAKLNLRASGAESLLYSTYIGSSQDDRAHSITADESNNIFIAGDTLGQFESSGTPTVTATEDVFLYQQPPLQTGRVLSVVNRTTTTSKSATLSPLLLLVLFMIYIKILPGQRQIQA